MNQECKDFQEVIWELARSGQEPEGHIAGCERCLRALGEAGKVLAVLREAGRVPDAPDCRIEVMARIQRPETTARRAFVYAFASAVVAAVALVGLILFHPKPSHPVHRTEQAGNVRSAPSPERREVIPPAVVKQANAYKAPAAVRHAFTHERKAVARQHNVRKRHRVVAQYHKRIHKPTARPDLKPETTAQAGAEALKSPQEDNLPEDASIAIVLTAEPAEPSSSFSYTIADVETGRTFTCSAERKGDTISVYAEQTTEQEQPGKRG